jgi:putative redox protein
MTATWTGRHVFRVDFPQGETLVLGSFPADERPAEGPSPMDAVEAALAVCTGIDVVMILEKMKKTPDALRIEADVERRAAAPRVFTHVSLTYYVDGKDLDAASVSRAVVLSREKYCSVSAMLLPTVPMSYRIVLNGEEVRS